MRWFWRFSILRSTETDALGRGMIGMPWTVFTKKGMILDPVGKAKSVVLTEEGERRCKELFEKHFCPSR